MKKQVFTKEQQAKVLKQIGDSFGKYIEDSQFSLWANLETGEVEYSENLSDYSEHDKFGKYVHIMDVDDYIYNVYYVYEEGEKELIETNFLEDFEIK